MVFLKLGYGGGGAVERGEEVIVLRGTPSGFWFLVVGGFSFVFQNQSVFQNWTKLWSLEIVTQQREALW